MNSSRLRSSVLAALAAVTASASAQDLGTLGIYVGNPNKGSAAAEAAFQARCAESELTIGESQTFVTGFVDYRQSLRGVWLDSANWWRTSVAASAAVRDVTPIYSVGLADGVTSDPVAQMRAIGNPQDTLYGPVFQAIINGFRTSGFPRLYLRIGWEHNGEWYPWATTNQDKTPNPERTAAFLAAWRRIADLAHNTPGIDVRTVWVPNFERLTPAQVAATYPGDDYVDIIAPDMYSPVWNAIPESWDPEGPRILPELEWKANLVNRQHTWDYPSASVENPTAGYGLIAMMDFALARRKPFGLGETGTDGGISSGIHRGPEDRGDFPLYLAKRLAEKRAQGLRLAYFGLWNANNYRFAGGARPLDTASWVTMVNILAGADPVQAEDLNGVTATDAVATLADPGATGNYVPDPSRRYVREADIGGEVSVLAANAVGDYAEYLVPVAAPGPYTVKLRLKRGPSHGRCRLVIDGVAQAPVHELYRASDDYVILDFGRKTFPTAGLKAFRLVVAGRHASSTGHTLAVDYFDLTPDRREIETLLAQQATDATLVFHEPAASHGSAERFDANAAGDYIEYVVPITEPGTYSFKVRVKKHNGRGRFQMSIDGSDQGAVQDLYVPYAQSNQYVELDLGTRRFTYGGEKIVRFTVTGKHPSSYAYWLALDYIAVTKVQ